MTDHPTGPRIIGKVAELHEGKPQWEVEVNGIRQYMTLAELRELAPQVLEQEGIPEPSQAERLLADLGALRDKLDLQELRWRELRDSVIPQDVQAKLSEIDAERETDLEPLHTAIAIQEERVRTAVLAAGDSVRAGGLLAVYSKPRVSWDTKALDGYAAAHPEVARFRKEGAPSVSIRNANRT
jgi:hypothetical protein